MRGRLRPTLLRWAVGVFCALVGGLMLIAPHQFGGPTFEPIRPWLLQAGIATFVSGVALVMVSAVGLRGPLAVAASVAAAVALLTLSASFALTGGWTGVAVYATFALAALISPLCDGASTPGQDRKQSIDLFVLTAAIAATLNGVLLLTFSAGGIGVFYDPLRSTISWHGILFLIGGMSVLATRLISAASRPLRITSQLSLGAAYLAWLLGSSIPNRIWTGILLYGGVGLMLVLGPRLARRTSRIDSSSLRVRLALAMASAAAFPLLFVATVATGWQERAAADQQLALQRALASGLAADVGGALTQHLVGLTLVAEHPVVLARSTAGPESSLGDMGEVAPGFVALGTFDAKGLPMVVLGRRGVDAVGRLPAMAAEALKRIPSGLSPSIAFQTDTAEPTIVLAVPIRQDGGGLDGVAVGELDRRWLEARLQRGVGDAHVSTVVVDGEGRALVAAGEPTTAGTQTGNGGDSRTNIASRPPIQALRDRGQSSGMLRFTDGGGEYLAGFARVPETDWAVVVEQPTATALAAVWLSRELTFGVLMAAFLAAAVLGVLLANRLAAPLALLARAAQALADGSHTSIIPRSRIYEVRVVARAFSEMQSRLLARTAERERAEARFRILAGASSELTRSLDEAAIVQALAKIVVDELADWCTVDMYGADGQLHRVGVVHADSTRQALASTLLALPPAPTPELEHAAATGASLLMAVITPKQIAEMAPNPEHRRVLEWLGVRSMLVVPLRVREQTVGTLGCILGRGGRRYGAEDLALAQELALRAALAIDNARLYAAEHAARAGAEAAVRVRDEFLAVAAHELKTPVTSLRGFAELGVRALDTRGKLDPTLARRTLETIDRQSARLAALVANLLEVARGSTDRTAISPRRVNLSELARNVVEAARVRAKEHTILLSVPEFTELDADPLRIEQVLTNLVDNAVKYSPTGTDIEVSLSASPTAIELVVRDHGFGVPPEHQERIFDRFFQAHAGGQTSGMGLGLYICREIVERHGGTIHAESPPDGGSRMVVSLPREATVKQPPRPPADPTAAAEVPQASVPPAASPANA
jgi:signal transduction histidine kinase